MCFSPKLRSAAVACDANVRPPYAHADNAIAALEDIAVLKSDDSVLCHQATNQGASDPCQAFPLFLSLFFIEYFHLSRVLIYSRPGRHRPRPATTLAHQSPARTHQRRSWFAGEDVGSDSLEAECEGGFRSCAVQEAAYVASSITAKSSNLRRNSVIPVPGHRSSDDNNPNNCVIQRRSDGK